MCLGAYGRFLVLVFGGLTIIVAIIIVACFVGPGCWGFEYLIRRENKKKLLNQAFRNNSGENTIVALHGCDSSKNSWIEEQDYVIYQTGPTGLEEKATDPEQVRNYYSKEKVFNLKCAPLLLGHRLCPSGKNSAPKLKVKLQYRVLGNDTTCRLSVHVLSASSLQLREYANTLDPYVCLQILNNKWFLQTGDRLIHSVRTRVIRNTVNPDFNQIFIFDSIKREMKNWSIKFLISDDDRLAKPMPLYEKVVYLKDVKNLTVSDFIALNLDMQKTPKNAGSLFFGISYLPTAQRVNFNIIKASKLKYQNHVPSLLEFYPYVRVVMLNNHGKCITKKKTVFKQGEFNPVFNQSFVFDLSLTNLEQAVFLILLSTKIMVCTQNETMSCNEDIEASLKESKDKVLGRIVLGRNVRNTRSRDHWVSVMRNPRKMISMWHSLV